MTETQHDLTIRGESVQRIYNWYTNRRFIANRRYQRKLVWSIDEKRSFVDSLVRGYPVPIVLLAEINTSYGKCFEIIDGMQRLNAVLSFIDGDYDYKGSYFDLNTMC